MNTQVIILGFHRSGTSVFSDYLHRCGLFLGSQLLGAAPSNPQGHFEDAEIVGFHNSILKRLGYYWLVEPPFFPVYSEQNHKVITHLISSRDTMRQVWGFKDPRTCLFWDLWDIHCSNPVYVVPIRHYDFCIDSVQRRAHAEVNANSPGRQRNQEIVRQPDIVAKSWLLHMTRVYDCISKRSDRSFVVNMHKILPTSYPVNELSTRFELGLNALPFNTVFKKSHFKATLHYPPRISLYLRRTCDELWREIMCYSSIDSEKNCNRKLFIIKTDNPEYEKLRIQSGLLSSATPKVKSGRPVTASQTKAIASQLTDIQIVNSFATRIRNGNYGRSLKLLYPLMSFIFDKAKKI